MVRVCRLQPSWHKEWDFVALGWCVTRGYRILQTQRGVCQDIIATLQCTRTEFLEGDLYVQGKADLETECTFRMTLS